MHFKLNWQALKEPGNINVIAFWSPHTRDIKPNGSVCKS